jgi:hypothetical protein
MADWPAGHEKAPTAPSDHIETHGIICSSRYSKGAELLAMWLAVERIPEPIRAAIKTIFCDSKATWCFSIKTRIVVEAPEGFAGVLRRLIGEAFGTAMCEVNGGHNGCMIDGIYEVCPDWQDEAQPPGSQSPS